MHRSGLAHREVAASESGERSPATERTSLAALDPASPPTQGGLRVSQRKLDETRSTESVSAHAHEDGNLVPGEMYAITALI